MNLSWIGGFIRTAVNTRWFAETDRYAHLAPENLVDAVSSIETRLHYGSTLDDNNKVTGEENHQVLEFTDENWWARKDSNLRPMDYESTALTN